MSRLIVCEGSEELASRAAAEIAAAALEAVSTRGSFTLCLSGGETPVATYSALAGEVGVPWDRVHVFWGDERCIPLERPDNHFTMATRLLLSRVAVPDQNVHRARGEADDPGEAAREYEAVLRSHFDPDPGDPPRMDLILLGMGDDGHVASLMPGSDGLAERDRWVVDHHVIRSDERVRRLTLTMPVLAAARRVVFLVAGVHKAATLAGVLAGELDVPARELVAAAPDVLWLVDRDAAGLLDPALAGGLRMKVLVTGGSGFIGSHVADALQAAGHEVTVLDLHRSPYLEAGQAFVQADILDEQALADAFEGQDAIYHFAGIAHLDIGLAEPIGTARQNVLGTVTALEAARRGAVKRFVYASSVYVYSERGSFYRCSKQAAELYVEEYQRLYDLDFTILRFGTVYGPRADRHNSVRRYLSQALADRRITASGTGDEIREYVHVRDAAHSSVQVLADEFRNERVVLTGHHPMRFGDLLTMISEMIGDVEVELRSADPEDARHGTSGHFVITPYSFRPKTALKLVANPYVDMGQGLLECLEEIHLELGAGADFPESEASHAPLDG